MRHALNLPNIDARNTIFFYTENKTEDTMIYVLPVVLQAWCIPTAMLDADPKPEKPRKSVQWVMMQYPRFGRSSTEDGLPMK